MRLLGSQENQKSLTAGTAKQQSEELEAGTGWMMQDVEE